MARWRACPHGLRAVPDAWYPANQVHHRCRYSMPPLRRPRRGPKPDRRRALELLARSRDGCTEAVLLAYGFTVTLLVELVRTGLVTAKVDLTMAGKQPIKVTRLCITEAGRGALT